MERQVRQPERQDGLLGARENANEAQSAQRQAEHRTDRKQAMRHHPCAAQAGESQGSNDQPACNHEQHIMEDQHVFHPHCLRCRQTSC
ncbi:hypothetical protein AWB68_06690 [Caballeronia choica]|uniref:Uncharacterized protein n=1 Tax=Caballeronia choica TaxID=326476 RepID=A0A158KP00_9BURK|nr:hypothetical protein AWB68_06690 [Caballeronia choica]